MTPATNGSVLRGLGQRLGGSARVRVGIEAERASVRIATCRLRDGRRTWSLSAPEVPDGEPVKSGGSVRPDDSATPDRRPDRSSGRPAPISWRFGASRPTAVCAVNSHVIEIFPLEFRAGDSDPLDQLVVAHAKSQLTRPLDELVLDYTPLPDAVRRPSGETKSVLVFAAPRELAESCLLRVEALGFDVVRLLTPACALAPRAEAAHPGERQLLLAVAYEATSISVVQLGCVLIERILPWGVRTLARRMSAELEMEERSCLELLTSGRAAQPDAEPAAGAPEGHDPMDTVFGEILAPALHELAREAATTADYCASVLRHHPISSAILIGSLSGHPRFQASMEHELHIPIRGPRDGVRLESLSDEVDGATYAVAAACALYTEDERP